MAIWLSMERDLRIALRVRSEAAHPLAFFVLVITVFSIGTGFSLDTSPVVGVGAVWVVALFATMLGLEGMFRRDFADGSLEQFLLYAEPLPLCVLARVAAHWFVSVLPLVLLSPVAGWMLGIKPALLPPLFLSLLLGTPALSLLGALGSALVLGVHRSGVLLALLVLPLFVPALVLGVSLATAETTGGGAAGISLWLLVLLLATGTVAPFAIAAALRASLQY